jgi:hypothetical protein
MSSSNISSNTTTSDISQEELLQVIGDFLAMGHVDNIRAMVKQEPEYLSFSGALIHDKRFAVRLGLAVLFEYLIEECPDEMYRAIPSLQKQLTNTQEWVRGEALNLLSIIGTAEALALVRPFVDDPSPQVAEIAKDILQADDSQ